MPLLHGLLIIQLALPNLPLRSYYTDTNQDGTKEWVEDPPPGDSWWEQDSDGDMMTNAEEALFGSDPYRIDSDYDGLTDKDERDLTPYYFGGLPSDPWNWSSDESGFSDYDAYYQQLQGNTPQVNYSNFISSGASFYSYYDADGDGVHNPWDSDPVSVDRDGDGILNWNDGYIDDPYNGATPPPDVVGYTHNGSWYPGFWQDSDSDGTPDPADNFPNGSYLWNGIEYAGGWIDTDMDGVPDSADNFPNGSFWYGAVEYAGFWTDSDSDGIPDVGDPYPTGSYFYQGIEYPGTWADRDQDGVPDPADTFPDISGSYWWNNIEYAGIPTDMDFDGIPDPADPFPDVSGSEVLAISGPKFS